MEEAIHPFVEYLISLREGDERGALADLRRGLGQPPGTAPAMYPYVVRYLPSGVSRREEAVYYLIAALFAYHDQAGGRGNMGDHFGATRDPNGENTAIERRFTALLAAHPDDLPFYLRQAVSYLKSKDVAVDWSQLFYDLRRWHYDDRRVQKRWARSFWGRAPQADREAADTRQGDDS
jgi:CRISPR type I-E-associated protein CasB/Cse2